jgi:hypothetical protein
MKFKCLTGIFLLTFLFSGATPNLLAAPGDDYDACQKKIAPLKHLAPETRRDTRLEKLLRSTRSYRESAAAGEWVRYLYNKVDLNGDGKPEAIVYLRGPYICGTGGCPALVAQDTPKGYRVVANIILAQTPFIVSEKKTRGWNDIISCDSGGGIQPHFVVFKWNGSRYPQDSADMKAGEKIQGQVVLSGENKPDRGIKL